MKQGKKTARGAYTAACAEDAKNTIERLTEDRIVTLIESAFSARAYAYAPYSGFLVGAALLDKTGGVHTGCNIENASYTPTVCAERTAVFSAVKKGVREFSAIAVVGAKKDQLPGFVTPCGVCRQVLAEFCGDDFLIIAAKNVKEYKIYTLRELLPDSFGPKNIKE